MTARVLFALPVLISLPLAAQTATSSIQGQVLDAKSGAPVRFANVTLLGPVTTQTLDPTRQARPAGTQISADEQGRFAFKDLAAGNYGVSAQREGYEPTRYGAVGTALLAVPEGKALADINIKMPPCGVIAGKVINEKGEPLRNVEMVALRYYYGAWLWRLASSRDIPLKVYTNDLGEFRMSNLVAGQYILRAAAPPQQPKTKGALAPTYPSVFFPSALSPEAAQPLMVDNGAVTPADIVLNPGPAYRISGVIDRAGSQQEVCFGLAPKHYNSAIAQVIGRVTRFSSTDGAFIIDDVPPGSYALSAAVCRGAEPLGAIQPLDVAGNIEGLKIQLSSGVSLSGMVKAEGFNPAGVRVVLRSPELLTTPVPNSVIREDGAFVVDHLVPRHYMVDFAGLPAGAYVKSVRYGGHEVTVAGFEWTADASLEIILSNQGAAQLSGVVTDKMGAPVAYPKVTVLPADGGPAESAKDVMGDENGKFVFAALRPGAYKALAWQTRFNPLGLEIADPMLPQLFEPNARTLTLAPGVPQTAQLTLNTVDDVNRARAAARMTPPKNQ